MTIRTGLFIAWSMDRWRSINVKATMTIKSEAALSAASLFIDRVPLQMEATPSEREDGTAGVPSSLHIYSMMC